MKSDSNPFKASRIRDEKTRCLLPVRVADVDVIVLLVVVPEVQSHTKIYQAVTNRTKLFKSLVMRKPYYISCLSGLQKL